MYYSSEQCVQPCSVQSVESGNIHCLEPGCNFRIHRLKQFQHHLTSEHQFHVNTLTLYFQNIQKFQLWKDEYEQDKGFTFCMLTTKDKASHVYYYCSLGRKARVVNGKRRMSNQCPTRLVLNCNKTTGQVYVELIDGHYGHPPPVKNTSLSSLQLSKREIQNLKNVMRLHNFDKTAVENYFNGLGLTDAKKELFMKEFEKKRFHEVYRWAESHFVAESPVTEWQKLMPVDEENAIIIHKRKGEIIQDLRQQNCHHRLNMEDFHVNSFMLGVMTDRQKEILVHYSNTIVLELVLPQEKSPEESIKQLYVLVMDHLGRELQVGFFVANCPDGDTRAFRSFFLAIKSKCGNLKPKLLIVNERTCLFKSWLEVFTDHVPCQLLSPWFIEAEFNSVMMSYMIPEPTMGQLDKLFVETMREPDPQIFGEKLLQLIKTLDSVTGAHHVLNYITTMLLPCHNDDSTSPVQPKWAHHEFPESKEDIALAIMTFTAEKLKGLHGFNNRKLGRCVYLMMQRQQQRRQLRPAQRASPSNRTTQPSPSNTSPRQEVQSEPLVDPQRDQERRNQAAELKERLQKIKDSLEKMTNDENARKIGEKLLSVTRSFRKPEKEKNLAFQIKVAADMYRNLLPEDQSRTVSSSSDFGIGGKRPLNINPSVLTVKRNFKEGPITLSSYTPTNRSSKRARLSPSLLRSAPNVIASGQSSNGQLAQKNNPPPPVSNPVAYSNQLPRPSGSGEPLTVIIPTSNQYFTGKEEPVVTLANDFENGTFVFNDSQSILVDPNGTSVTMTEIIDGNLGNGSNNISVITSQPNQTITNISEEYEIPTSIPVQFNLPSFNVQVSSQCSTTLQKDEIPDICKMEVGSPSQVVWQIKSGEDGEDETIHTKVKEELDTDIEGLTPQKLLVVNADEEQDLNFFSAWS